MSDDHLADKAFIENTSAIMAVHIYGRRCHMDLIHRLAGRWPGKKPKIVEDLAEAHGIAPHQDTDAACWSFYRNKIVAGEEGGMVAFRDPNLVEVAKSLRSLGFTEHHDFMHLPGGFNCRLSNANAEVVKTSLKDVDWNQRRRLALHQVYQELVPQEWQMPDTRQANWVYDLRIPGLERGQQDAIVKQLREKGVEARHAFKPMSMQPEFNKLGTVFAQQKLSAYRLSCEMLYLPIHPSMSRSHVEWGVKCLREAVADVVPAKTS